MAVQKEKEEVLANSGVARVEPASTAPAGAQVQMPGSKFQDSKLQTPNSELSSAVSVEQYADGGE